MNCSNCNAKLSCGCQQRTASNGVPVCSNCIGAYENMLKQANVANIQEQNPPQTPQSRSDFSWNLPNNYYPKR